MIDGYIEQIEANIKSQYPKAQIIYQILDPKDAGWKSAETIVQVIFDRSEVTMSSSQTILQEISFTIYADRDISKVSNDAKSRTAYLAQWNFGQNLSKCVEDASLEIGDSISNQDTKIEIAYGLIGDLKFGSGKLSAAVAITCNITLER